MMKASSKKAPAAPKKSTFYGVEGDQDAYEAAQEKKLTALARVFPTTGRGAHSAHFRAQKAKTAAKVMKDFAEHKAAQLAARAAGADAYKTRIDFSQFSRKLRDQTGRRAKAKAAKAAKVLKKSVVEKL